MVYKMSLITRKFHGTDFSLLPDELWLRVFSFLGAKKICQLEGVCKKLNRLSKDVSLRTAAFHSIVMKEKLDYCLQKKSFRIQSLSKKLVLLVKDRLLFCQSSQSSSLLIYDLNVNKRIAELTGHSKKILFCSKIPSNQLATADGDALRIWSIQREDKMPFRLLQTYNLDNDEIVLIKESEGCLYFGSKKGNIHIVDLNTFKMEKLGGHLDALQDKPISFLQMTGNYLVSRSKDETKIWNLESKECLQTFTSHLLQVAGDCVYYYGPEKGDLMIFNVKTNEKLKSLEVDQKEKIKHFEVVGDHLLAKVYCEHCQETYFKVWKLKTGEPMTTAIEKKQMTCWKAAEKALCVGFVDGTIKTYDLKTLELIHELKTHHGRVTYLEIFEDRLFSGGEEKEERRSFFGFDDSTLKIWDLISGKCLASSGKSFSAVKSLNIYENCFICEFYGSEAASVICDFSNSFATKQKSANFFFYISKKLNNFFNK
jgi:WD40 repeat protein